MVDGKPQKSGAILDSEFVVAFRDFDKRFAIRLARSIFEQLFQARVKIHRIA